MKYIGFVMLAFVAGFTVRHYVSAFNIVQLPTQPVVSASDESKDVFITAVKYTNGRFEPSQVTLQRGNYLTITNMSTSLMWLVSETTGFTTPRAYGESEQFKVRVEQPGTYKVQNKLHLPATLTVIVH